MLNNLDANEPIKASVEALKRFFLRQMNAQLMPVWDESEGQDSLDYIPFEGDLPRVGLTGLRANRVLSFEERTEIAHTFQTIVGGFIALRERARDLRRLEALHTIHLSEDVNNVVPMVKPHYYSEDSTKPTNNSENRWNFKLDCLIESPQHAEIFKMARELHEVSHRHAFVEFKDLEEGARIHPDQFTSMGGITVFVPDIFMLSRQEQFCLTQVIRHDAAHRPLVMVGTHVTFARLKEDKEIQWEFLSLISRAYLKLTKPVAQYKSEGLFHYFLDSLC